jgi:hypothetical protein
MPDCFAPVTLFGGVCNASLTCVHSIHRCRCNVWHPYRTSGVTAAHTQCSCCCDGLHSLAPQASVPESMIAPQTHKLHAA